MSTGRKLLKAGGWSHRAVAQDEHFARFSIHKTPEGKFAISAAYELKGYSGGASPATGSIATYADALRLALADMEKQLGRYVDDRSSVCQPHHRAAARAALNWIDARRAEWGLSEPTSQEQRT